MRKHRCAENCDKAKLNGVSSGGPESNFFSIVPDRLDRAGHEELPGKGLSFFRGFPAICGRRSSRSRRCGGIRGRSIAADIAVDALPIDVKSTRAHSP